MAVEANCRHLILFADVCAILVHNASEPKAKVEQLQSGFGNIGLEINLSKTKRMRNKFCPSADYPSRRLTYRKNRKPRLSSVSAELGQQLFRRMQRARRAACALFNETKIMRRFTDEWRPSYSNPQSSLTRCTVRSVAKRECYGAKGNRTYNTQSILRSYHFRRYPSLSEIHWCASGTTRT